MNGQLRAYVSRELEKNNRLRQTISNLSSDEHEFEDFNFEGLDLPQMRRKAKELAAENERLAELALYVRRRHIVESNGLDPVVIDFLAEDDRGEPEDYFAKRGYLYRRTR